MQINSWEKHHALKKILLMTFNAEKKSYTVIYREKISNSREVWENHPYPTLQPTLPQTSNSHVNHLGGEGRNGFDT